MKACCERCQTKLCASKVPIFSYLSNDELIDIVKMTGHREYKKGETIFLEETEAETLYIINEGKIKLYKYTKEGKEQILHLLTDGDFFGELNLLKKGKYSFNAEAMASTKLCTLTKEKMRALILQKPEIGLKILEYVSERLARLEALAQSLATNDVEARIAHLLIEFKEKYGKKVPRGIEITLPVNREEMSNYIGVARETISRKLKNLEDQGIIKLEGVKKIIILDEGQLEDFI